MRKVKSKLIINAINYNIKNGTFDLNLRDYSQYYTKSNTIEYKGYVINFSKSMFYSPYEWFGIFQKSDGISIKKEWICYGYSKYDWSKELTDLVNNIKMVQKL